MKNFLFVSKLKKLSLLVFLLAISYGTNYSQIVVDVPPGAPGTLEDAIESDSTHSDVTYLLHRGGIYLYNATMKPNFNLTLKATGTGDMPIIMGNADVGGGQSPRPFEISYDMTVTGICFSGVNNADPPIESSNGFIRVKAQDVTLKIDSCRFDGNRQESLRFDDINGKLIVTNTVISNNYDIEEPNDGWNLQHYGVEMDSIIFSNCTFYNTDYWQKQPERQAKVNYVKIEHCTFHTYSGTMKTVHPDSVSILSNYEKSRYAVISFMNAKKFVFRNNLLVNVGFIGMENPVWEPSALFLPRYIVNIDSAYSDDLHQLVAPEGADIRNNNIWNDPSLVYPDSMVAYPESHYYDPTCTRFIDKLGSAATLTTIEPDFIDAPGSPQEYMDDGWFMFNAGLTLPPFYMPKSSKDPSFGPGTSSYFPNLATDLYGPDPAALNFGYTTSDLLTASTQGQPLGDLNWFDVEMIPTQDEFADITDVEKTNETIPNEYALTQNFPNPFNPTTQINYSIPKSSFVSLKVFNELGQEIATLYSGEQVAGNYTVTFDASKLSSGVYFYRFQANDFLSVKKMILIK